MDQRGGGVLSIEVEGMKLARKGTFVPSVSPPADSQPLRAYFNVMELRLGFSS